MGQLLLKMTFYLAAGVMLSAITWSTLSHSAVTGDYILSVILLGMMFFIVGQFFVDRLRPEYGAKDFHPRKLWKMPRSTTHGGLWLRVAFNTAVGMIVYAALAAALVIATTAQPAFMALLGALFLLRIPHLYWTMRGYYEQTGSQTALRYAGGSQMNRNARWLIPMSMGGAGAGIAAVVILLG